MSEDDGRPAEDPTPVDPYDRGGRRKRGRGLPGCLAVVVALALLAGGGYLAITKAADFLSDHLGSAAEDYPGPGKGKVTFEVQEGDSAADIGRRLKEKGVVASVQAFIDAANADDRSRGIQVGYYPLQKQMPAADALEVLVDSDNLMIDTVTVPEGLRVVDIVDLLGKQTEFSAEAYQKVLRRPAQLGLPDFAGGNPEGYLFPSTYNIGPKDTPATILTMMVDKWREVAEETDLEGRAAELGYEPGEIMVVASLVEAEGRGEDMPKIARVLYNRLENPDNGVTYGLLQVDASVNYALDRKGTTALTQAEIDSVASSPFNTYTQAGLPPTPIEAPGRDAISAALNPADGDWLFYVTVNLKTGETKFTDSYEEFLRFKAEYQEYCQTSDAC